MKNNKKVFFVSFLLVLVGFVFALVKGQSANQDDSVILANNYPIIETTSVNDGMQLCNNYPVIEITSVDDGMLLCNNYPVIEIF